MTPFFTRADEPGQESRRLLLISYHFPPSRTVGALRWQKIARYAAERGWGLDVVTLDPADVAHADPARLEDLPPGVRLFGVATTELLADRAEYLVWRAYRAIRAGRKQPKPADSPQTGDVPAVGPAARPDFVDRDALRWRPRSTRDLMRAYWAWAEAARIGRWARRAAAVAERLYLPGVHRAVVTSGPPHPVHEAGRQVGRRTGIPFVMDMRDPWSLYKRLPEETASPVRVALARRQERRAVAAASLVVANTEPFRDAMAALYPDRDSHIVAVMNGSDEDPLPAADRGARFVVAYAGTIYIERDPRSLFRAAAGVIEELDLTPSDFGLEFIGHFSEAGAVPLHQIAQEEGVADFVQIGPARSHAEALQFLAGAMLLVTFPGHNEMITVPAKTFECARFDAWLLALSDRGSATDLLLRDTEADVVPPEEIDEIARVLRRRFEQHARGERPRRIVTERLSRRVQAGRLLDAVEAVTGSPRRDAEPVGGPRVSA